MKKLNLGCGKDIRKGYVNVDCTSLQGVDIVHNLEKYPWPFKDGEFDEIVCGSILEHLDDIIKPMEEIWRISKNKSIIKIWVPLYPGIGCFADPTHKQVFTYMSFNYFRPEDGLNYYSKARFKIVKKKIIFSRLLKIIEPIVNINSFFQKFYYVLLSFLLPPYLIYFKLEVLKGGENEKKTNRV